jgi:regulator of protease activity HflC (stomatin/prohibitin superfamily)
LATAFFSTLSAAYAAGLFEGNELLDALLGSAAVMALLSLAGAVVVTTVLFIASFLLATHMSGEWILALHEVYGVTRQEARQLVKSMYLNTAYAFCMVENGEITKTKPEGLLPKLGGPGKVVIKPYNAVVFEQAGKTTRIEGPGTVLTKRHELQKEIVDLRKQSEAFIAENVLTKDQVPLTFHCSVGFCIESLEDTETRLKGQREAIRSYRDSDAIGGDYAVYKRTLHKAVYGPTAAGWKVTSRGATESKLREVVREYLLADLYQIGTATAARSPSVIDQIVKETLSRVSAVSHNWGTTITSFSIKTVTIPEDVEAQLQALWAAPYAVLIKKLERDALSESIQTRGVAEAAAIAAIEGAKRAAREELLQALRTQLLGGQTAALDETLVSRFLDAVERLSVTLTSDTATAGRYIDALEKIAEAPGTKVLLVGGDSRLLPPLSGSSAEDASTDYIPGP